MLGYVPIIRCAAKPTKEEIVRKNSFGIFYGIVEGGHSQISSLYSKSVREAMRHVESRRDVYKGVPKASRCSTSLAQINAVKP